MKTYGLLRMCADKLEQHADVFNPLHATLSCLTPDIILTQPRGTGRFPFAGGGTELLSATQEHTNYSVPVHRVLSYLAKRLKAEASTN